MSTDTQTPPAIDDAVNTVTPAPCTTADIDVLDVLEEFNVGTSAAHAEPRELPLHPRIFEIEGRKASVEQVTACPVCDGEQARPRFAVESLPHRVVVCTDCGLGRLYPLPAVEEIQRFYPMKYYGMPGSKFVPFVESLVRWAGTRRVGMLSRGLAAGARILDVGCGRGVLLTAFANRGFEVHGVEMSADAAAGADPRAEIRIAPCLQEAEYPDSFFDQVIVWHVLEHMRNPAEALAEIHRILKPGGRLVVAVPNFASTQARWSGAGWLHLDLPRHLFQFPATALNRLLQRSGFDCRMEHYFSLRQNPFGWVQSALNRRRTFSPNALYSLLHRGSRAQTSPLNWSIRLKLWLAFGLGMPLGLLLSVWMAWRGRGATVCIVAESRRRDNERRS